MVSASTLLKFILDVVEWANSTPEKLARCGREVPSHDESRPQNSRNLRQ